MRSVICLYLAFTKDGDYHRGWTHIAYVLMSLGGTEEETLLIFTHLVQNVLPVIIEYIKMLTSQRALPKQQKIMRPE